ncbi:MAG: glycosyl transferase [Duncaniella sp.]|nr:glycosyl transferase [Duncaniella sp.]
MIPKIIHYCWLSDDEIPETLKKCMESWHRILPDYEFILWDRNRFDITSVPWVNEAYSHRKYAFAADYIRLYAIYTHGGIYLDMDVEIIQSFDSLLSRPYILGYEKKNGIEAGIFGGEKGASWIKDCLDYYTDRHFINSNGDMDTLPLPRIMYKTLYPQISEMTIFPNEYLTAKSYYTGEITITPNTYSIHHFAGSWLSPIETTAYEIRKKIPFLPEKMKGHISKFLATTKIKGFSIAVIEELKWIRRKLSSRH